MLYLTKAFYGGGETFSKKCFNANLIQSVAKFGVSFYAGEVLAGKERGFSLPVFSVQNHLSPSSVYVRQDVVSALPC